MYQLKKSKDKVYKGVGNQSYKKSGEPNEDIRKTLKRGMAICCNSDGVYQGKLIMGCGLIGSKQAYDLNDLAKEEMEEIKGRGHSAVALMDAIKDEDQNSSLWDVWRKGRYELKTKDDVLEKINGEIIKWEGEGGLGKSRYNTGYKGRGGRNEVVDLNTCAGIMNEWVKCENAGKYLYKRSAHSFNYGKQTNCKMQDFMISETDGGSVFFNFHIEVERDDGGYNSEIKSDA